MPTTPALDLDAQRAERRATTGESVPLTFGGTTYRLPPELPLEVFAPFEEVDMDIALLVRASLDAFVSAKKGEEDGSAALVLIDILAANPDLPKEMLEAIRAAARALLGDECYMALIAWKPSVQDTVVLAKGLASTYAVSLGEASASSDSSEDAGQTSSPTSSGSTGSTRRASSRSRKADSSSEPAE